MHPLILCSEPGVCTPGLHPLILCSLRWSLPPCAGGGLGGARHRARWRGSTRSVANGPSSANEPSSADEPPGIAGGGRHSQLATPGDPTPGDPPPGDPTPGDPPAAVGSSADRRDPFPLGKPEAGGNAVGLGTLEGNGDLGLGCASVKYQGASPVAHCPPEVTGSSGVRAGEAPGDGVSCLLYTSDAADE